RDALDPQRSRAEHARPTDARIDELVPADRDRLPSPLGAARRRDLRRAGTDRGLDERHRRRVDGRMRPAAAVEGAMSGGGDLAVRLSAWDWGFVLWFLAVTTGVGLWYAKRAGRNLQEYFLSGRSLPWWALGTSIVATTFAADTPLVVAGY